MDIHKIASEYEKIRPELTSYLTRLVIRADVAQELAQSVALRAIEAADEAPRDPLELRPWLFRIATNLGIDERRRHGAWRETLMVDSRQAAESSNEFVQMSMSLRGSPEVKSIAREHLVVCFSCTLGQLPSELAASLLLKEVYGFSNEAVAEALGARFAQVKNWLQEARAAMARKYDDTCALIRKEGVCHQCVELDQFFGSNQGSPMARTDGGVSSRLRVLQEFRDKNPGPWHSRLMEIFRDLN